MERFEGRLAVVTGGGTGMGRELARQLATEGCHVAICDVSEENMAHTRALCEKAGPGGLCVSTFQADVSEEDQVLAFRDAVAQAHGTDHIHLLFNNAGIGGGGSFVGDSREDWEKTFAVCWNGVYYCTRAFLPMLLASPEGHVVNTSSVNGFWASLGPQSAHTAYSAAKFAVKGFTEALINDFRLNAPHLKVSLVMPGHIGTSIVENATTEQVRQGLQLIGETFRDNAPMTAAEAATVILDGVRKDQWRILVGDDAHALDQLVREDPEEAYEPAFMDKLRSKTTWMLGT
jgi:NAD(P)-dependent dehydrogenase (short-subunit alcohol dehydrogenase family)